MNSQNKDGSIPFRAWRIRATQFRGIDNHFLPLEAQCKSIHIARGTTGHPGSVRSISRLVPGTLKPVVLRPPIQRRIFVRAGEGEGINAVFGPDKDYIIVPINADSIRRREGIGALCPLCGIGRNLSHGKSQRIRGRYPRNDKCSNDCTGSIAQEIPPAVFSSPIANHLILFLHSNSQPHSHGENPKRARKNRGLPKQRIEERSGTILQKKQQNSTRN